MFWLCASLVLSLSPYTPLGARAILVWVLTGGEDFLLDNGVRRVRASRNRCRGDGSDVGGSVGDDWGRQMALDS